MTESNAPSRGRTRGRALLRGAPWLFLLALLLWGWALPAEAVPIRRMGQNPRGLALGGTGMSYADDEMALYYNPAGLGSVTNFWIELLPIALEASPDGYDLLRDKADSGDTDLATLSGLSDLISENIGKDLHYRGFAYPTAVIGLGRGLSFGAGVFWESEVDVMFHNQATPEADAYYRKDTGGALGFAFPVAQGKLLLGISGRRITRETGEGTISSADLAIAAANDKLDLTQVLTIQKGSGTAFDAGAILRLEAFPALRSQLSVAVQNIGDADLGDAGKIPQEVAVGWAAKPKFSPLFRGLFAVEFRDAAYNTTDDKSSEKRTHVGFELGFLPQDVSTNLVTGRVGWGQGGLSWGIEFALWHSFSIQYVYYEQEYGERAGEDLRKRHILQFNLLGFTT